MIVYDNNESRMVVMSQECLLIIAIVREIINNRVRQGSPSLKSLEMSWIIWVCFLVILIFVIVFHLITHNNIFELPSMVKFYQEAK